MPKNNHYKRNCEIRKEIVFPKEMHRIALSVEYKGDVYNGFQRQTSTSNTVQQYLEKALSCVANETITLVCAGRTDAGVHATQQFVHFDTLAIRDRKAWTMGVNSNLPEHIRVTWSQPMPPTFHARFSAKARQYCYIISICEFSSVFLTGLTSWIRSNKGQILNVDAMHKAAQALQGEHDFTTFRAVSCQAAHAIRYMHLISVEYTNGFVVMHVKANAFLYHMVRNIAGSLIEIGLGHQSEHWMAELLCLKDRTEAAKTAAANGLYFVGVDYPSEFKMPSQIKLPHLLKTNEILRLKVEG